LQKTRKRKAKEGGDEPMIERDEGDEGG